MRTIDVKSYLHECILDREKVVDWKQYPFCIPAIKNLERLLIHPGVTFFTGENGSGKSTLLEAIAVKLRLNPEGGGRNFMFNTRTSHSELSNFLTLEMGLKRPRDLYFMRAESFFNLATEIEKLDEGPQGPPLLASYGGRSLHEQSHGESFLSFLKYRIGKGLYLFDEPEAALSPTGQLGLLRILKDRVSDGSQFIISTHSPILLGYPCSIIYNFCNDGINQIEYQQSDSYIITQEFLKNREKMLSILFNERVEDED